MESQILQAVKELLHEVREMRTEMESLKQEMRAEMESFKQEMRTEMESFKQEIREEIKELHVRIGKLETKVDKLHDKFELHAQKQWQTEADVYRLKKLIGIE
ncbi:coiled-coil domain-containing protein [Anoxybacillus gonensis]|uniref:coiled-coil domain-containing protein n=1 Tax=Anoxybacillus gonensis TaxID=198467 RepID=UPI0002C027D6|nr:coiled-coil domain-containing protein [Anoxybacillus gonensis]EMI10433.1 hypothetical protein F510_1456 [Anoxybacillus gonensis]